jgi:phosphatidate cytidylyltransferase
MTRTRLLAALFMTPLAIAAVLFLPTPWLVALAAVLFLAGLWEWLRLAEVDDTLHRTVLLVANLAMMVAIVWASRTPAGFSFVLFQIATVAGVVWWLFAMLWLKHFDFASDHDSHARIFKLAAGTLAVIPAWAALALIHGSDANGHVWFLIALVVIWAADTGAYFAGRKFGKRKLSPRISPNKTVEGFIGGMLASLAVALVAAPFAGATVAQLPKVALVVAVTVGFSVVGDLFESLLKRHVGAKDSGDLIPGHGGILDRIDSVLAALPVFALGKGLLGF